MTQFLPLELQGPSFMHDTIITVESYGEFEEYARRWNRFVEHSRCNHIYARHEWYKAVIKAENLHDRLHIVLVERGGELAAIAPMIHVPNYTYLNSTIRALTFIDNKVTPENVLIVNPQRAESATSSLLEYLCDFQQWDLVVLRKILENGNTENTVKSFLEEIKTLKLGKHRNIESPYIHTLDWQSLFGSLSKKRQKDYRRIEKNIRKQGFKIELLPHEGREPAQLEMICQVSARSWKGEIRSDLLSDARQRKFYEEIMKLFGEKNIQIWVLKSEDEIIGFEFLLIHEGVAYPIRADFDGRFKQYSPGTYLMGQVLKGLCEDDGVVEYHTCAHAYDYLMAWSQGTRKHTNLEIFKNRGKARLLYHLKYNVAPLLRRAKRSSPLR